MHQNSLYIYIFFLHYVNNLPLIILSGLSRPHSLIIISGLESFEYQSVTFTLEYFKLSLQKF
jgi:hypothetical protein